MFGLFANDCPEETWEEMIENNVDEYIESFLDDMEYWDNQPIEQVLNIGSIWKIKQQTNKKHLENKYPDAFLLQRNGGISYGRKIYNYNNRGKWLSTLQSIRQLDRQ